MNFSSSFILACTTFIYGTALVFHIGSFSLKKEILAKLGFWILVVGFLANTTGIGLRWVESYQLGYGHAPFSNMYESLVFFSWTAVLLHIILEFRHKGNAIGPFVALLAFLAMAYADLLRKKGHSPSEAFNETVEELTESLIRLVSENGMDWMYANCSTTAQRGALDWSPRFKNAVMPVFEDLYQSVISGKETQIVMDANSAPDYREKLEKELTEMRESEMWKTGASVRALRPTIRR